MALPSGRRLWTNSSSTVKGGRRWRDSAAKRWSKNTRSSRNSRPYCRSCAHDSSAIFQPPAEAVAGADARMKVGLIIANLQVARWQANALAKLDPDTEFFLYNCTHSDQQIPSWRHAFYYLLNLAAIRSALTRSVQIHRVVR